MSVEIVRARVLEHLDRLRLGRISEQLDALLSAAARGEPTYIDFLDTILREEVGAKQRKRVAMGIQIAHFPTVKTLDDFDFKFQPSVDQKLVRELAVGRYISQADNVLVFGPPGVGKSHLAIALGRAAVEAGYSVLFTSATALLGALSKAETEGQLTERLAFYCKPKLLIVDELGYLPFEKRSAHLFFQLVARRYEKGSMLITTNQVVTQWGTVFGDEVLAGTVDRELANGSRWCSAPASGSSPAARCRRPSSRWSRSRPRTVGRTTGSSAAGSRSTGRSALRSP